MSRRLGSGFERLESRDLMANMYALPPLVRYQEMVPGDHNLMAPIVAVTSPQIFPVLPGDPQSLFNRQVAAFRDRILHPYPIPATGVMNAPMLVTSSSTASQYVVGGTINTTKATYNFSATGGSVVVNQLKFIVVGDNSSAVTKITVGGFSAVPVNGVADLKGLNLVVPNGGAGLNVDALVSYAFVGAGGIPSATKVAIGLSDIGYRASGVAKTLALTNPVMAPAMTLVGSKPTVVVNAISNAGLVMGAENKIGEVTVAADPSGDIKLNDLRFSVSSVNFAVIPTFTQARIADGTRTIVGSSCGQGVAGHASQTIFCEFGTVGNTMASTINISNVESNTDFDGYIIPAGTSKTFSLYATVNGVLLPAGTASISTSLVSAGFNWDDASSATFVADGTNASPANGINLTGLLIKNFSPGSYVIYA